MNCQYFGICGSCKLYAMTYEEQLALKKHTLENLITPFLNHDIEIFPSDSEHFRSRIELQVFHRDIIAAFAMSGIDKKPITIENCKIANQTIYDKIPSILSVINSDEVLRKKLYSIDFLTSNQGELLINAVYHKKLDELWEKSAKIVSDTLDIKIIGRSRNQKIALQDTFVTDILEIDSKKYTMRKYEGAFSQPNGLMNEKMLNWAVESSKNFGGDLIEMYCGNGNFTIPLSKNFDKVFASEISKTSIKTVQENCELNNITNISFARLSGEEVKEALNQEREFFRLREIALGDFNFTTVFVDPPRAGLGEDVARFIARFDNIIYISCNPHTLKDDLHTLHETHEVTKAAMFDQFPWSEHLESGVILQKRR